MKTLLTLCTVLLLLLSGQNSLVSAEIPEKDLSDSIICSNLNDESSRALLSRLMTTAEIVPERQAALFAHIDQINQFLKPEELTDGFTSISITSPLYDSYDLQARWDEAHPDFIGYNCRLTAFSLFEDFLELPTDGEIQNDFIFLDQSALSVDPSALPSEASQQKFGLFYSVVQTENTKDIRIHAQHWLQAWKDRGISFSPNPHAKLISVIFHDQIDDDQLFIGHTGILFPSEDGYFYFLEKIAFQEPYQLCRFEHREDVWAYLMAKYDIEHDQPTASPFILENDQLMNDIIETI